MRQSNSPSKPRVQKTDKDLNDKLIKISINSEIHATCWSAILYYTGYKVILRLCISEPSHGSSYLSLNFSGISPKDCY